MCWLRCAKRLALEDPSSGEHALPAARAAGLEVSRPRRRDGIRVDVLRKTDADAVVLTPSQSVAPGSVLSPQNRAAVLRWAARRGAVVIEERYDAEYRYDGRRSAPCRACPGSVVYARIGQQDSRTRAAARVFVLPSHLAGPNGHREDRRRPGLSSLEQLALSASSPAESSTATCGACAPLTAGAATCCCGTGRGGCPGSSRQDLRRPAPGHLAAAPPRRDHGCRGGLRAGVGIDAVGPYRIRPVGPGRSHLPAMPPQRKAIQRGIDILHEVISQL